MESYSVNVYAAAGEYFWVKQLSGNGKSIVGKPRENLDKVASDIVSELNLNLFEQNRKGKPSCIISFDNSQGRKRALTPAESQEFDDALVMHMMCPEQRLA